MAQNTTQKKTTASTQRKPAGATQTKNGQTRSAVARTTNQKVVRNNSNVPTPNDKAPVPVKAAPKSSAGKGTEAAKKGKNKQNKKIKNKENKSVQLIPYILIVVSILFVMCFVTNAFCNPQNYLDGGSEGDHALGYVGYYVCEIVLGIFGPAAYAIPLVLLNLAMFWKNYMENEKTGVKITLTVSTLIAISALLHVLLNIDEVDMLTNFVELYEMGAARQGGGILGGYIALGLVKLGRVPLAIFILVAVLIPLILFLVGTHPQAMIDKISAWASEQKKAAAADRARREEDKKYEKLQAQKEDLKRQKKLEAQQKKLDEQKAQYYAQKEEVKEENTGVDGDSDDVIINNAVFDEPAEQYADESESYELDYSNLNSEPDMSDSLREDSDDKEEIVLNLENIGDDYEQLDGEDNPQDDSIRFVINNPDDEPPMEEYGAAEDDFGGDLDATLAEGYVVDEVTGEIIGDRPAQIKPYKFPPFDLLKSGPASYAANQEEISKNTRILRDTLESFKVKINEVSCSCGPTVTRYEIKPAPGVKVKQIANLGDDIAMGLAKSGVRIEAPIPGKAAVGVEVPNDDRSTVFLRNIIEAPEFQNHKSKTAACLGADISGRPIVFDIEKMPHLLVAGTTGSGKSICINSIIMSILYKAKPSEVKLVLIDPKKVEFNVYKDIPHLSCRIVSDPKKAAGALNSAVNEMEKRFKLIEQVGVRNITGYNEITKDDPDMPYMPRMVIIIDELADLMMTAKEDVETAICRIAQKARAAGIHLILGTQRPSVDVITGLIKANVPSRIAFTVRSMVDSRTVIDISGAEKLLGMGDMLYMPVGAPKPIRVQGAFVGDAEVEKIVDYIKDNNDPVVYDSDFEKSIDEEAAKCGNPKRSASDDMDSSEGNSDSEDPKFWEAIELAIDAGKISTSLLQRRLEIGYGRAAKIIDRLEERGFVGPADGNKPRKILVTHQDIAEKRMNG